MATVRPSSVLYARCTEDTAHRLTLHIVRHFVVETLCGEVCRKDDDRQEKQEKQVADVLHVVDSC